MPIRKRKQVAQDLNAAFEKSKSPTWSLTLCDSGGAGAWSTARPGSPLLWPGLGQLRRKSSRSTWLQVSGGRVEQEYLEQGGILPTLGCIGHLAKTIVTPSRVY